MAIETPSCCDTQYDLLRKILLSLPSITETGTNICGFTPESVIFAGPTGCLTEDPTAFRFDSINDLLTIGEARIFTYGNNNFFIGENSGNLTTTGNNNLGVGFNTLMSLTLGDANEAFGSFVLENVTTGSGNIAVGRFSQNANVSGGFNVSVGGRTLEFNTASYNVAIGRLALGSNSSGEANVSLGHESGYTSAPANANTTGSNNVFIGYQSGPASVTQRTNAIAIGYRALVDADNSMVLGGTGGNAVSVGIGVTAPNSRLQSSGAISTPISTKAGSYSITSTDSVILANATAAPLTITLPTPVGIDGRRYTVKKIDATANAVTIATAAGTIDGAATKVTTVQYVSFDFVSNGANWFIV